MEEVITEEELEKVMLSFPDFCKIRVSGKHRRFHKNRSALLLDFNIRRVHSSSGGW